MTDLGTREQKYRILYDALQRGIELKGLPSISEWRELSDDELRVWVELASQQIRNAEFAALMKRVRAVTPDSGAWNGTGCTIS